MMRVSRSQKVMLSSVLFATLKISETPCFLKNTE